MNLREWVTASDVRSATVSVIAGLLLALIVILILLVLVGGR